MTGPAVQTRSSRAVALVAFLAAHAGVPQPRQRIAGMFWPDSTDAQALTNLRRELHHLRQVLGDDRSLVVTPRDLCWRDSETCRVDLRVFETERQAALASAAAGDDEGVLWQAAAAVAQYKGDLLPGVYDDWLLEARAALERECADLCDLLCAARARTGDLAGAADAVRRRIQLQPLEEAGYRTLMLLQADLGDRAGAVSTYHHCASVLERELGVIPDPATRQTFQRLMAHADPASARLPSPQPAAGRSGFAAAQLVGRLGSSACCRTCGGPPRQAAPVWRWSAAALASARHGWWPRSPRWHGCKARWWRAASASEHRGGWPWRRWRTGCGTRPFRPRRRALDPAWRAEVGRLVPAGGRGERAAGSRSMADAWQRHRFFEGLARALMAVGRPVLLVLDNMQWCDQETLAFLTFFLGLAPDTPVLVAGTLRNDTAREDPELADWIVRMRATGLMTELSLGPLDAAGHGTARRGDLRTAPACG